MIEEFCKNTLAIYKPWQFFLKENIDLFDDTYFTTLKEFMWDPEFPGSIRANILRVKRSEKWKIDSSDLPHWGLDGTLLDECENEANKGAADVAVCALVGQPQAPVDTEHANDNIEYRLRLRTMNRRVSDNDWLMNYGPIVDTNLEKYKGNYYKEAMCKAVMVKLIKLYNYSKRTTTDQKRLGLMANGF